MELYEGIFQEAHDIRDINLLENLLFATPNYDPNLSDIWENISDEISSLQEKPAKLKELLLFLIRPALKSKSIFILEKIIELYNSFKDDINLSFSISNKLVKQYEDIIFPELDPLIRRAELIVTVDKLINIWDLSKQDYNVHITNDMDDIVNRLEKVNL